MSIKFDKLRKYWFDNGYDGMLMLPIKTEFIIKGGKRHIVTHRSVSFVWINGNQENYPLVVIPLKNYSTHIDYSVLDYGAYNVFLEYLSLLSLVNWNLSIDILHRCFDGGYLSNHFHDLESLDVYYPRVSLGFNLDKQEFRTKSDLTTEENLILSLFREGNSSENIFHSYLAFFRIFEFLLYKKDKMKDKDGNYKKNKNGGYVYDNGWSYFNNWIDYNLGQIQKWCIRLSPATGDYHFFMENYKNSKKDTIGDYLRDNCRNTIAHGKLDTKRVKAANIFNDYLELNYARSFIKAAAYMIVHEKLGTEIIIRNRHKKY